MDLLLEDVFNLSASLVLGAIIGSEREYHNKTAGFRTITLICFSSALFTILSIKIGLTSPDRIAANIVTGIGFLGAGAIFKEENKVGGLTTAATIWASAAIGMCVGNGQLWLGLFAVLAILTILALFPYLEKYIDNANESRNYIICVNYNEMIIKKLENYFKKHKLKFKRHKFVIKNNAITCNWVVVGKHHSHENYVYEILNNSEIKEFSF